MQSHRPNNSNNLSRPFMCMYYYCIVLFSFAIYVLNLTSYVYRLSSLKMLFLHWKTQELPGALSSGPSRYFTPGPHRGPSLSGPLDSTSRGSCALRTSIFFTLRKRFLINGAPSHPFPRAPSSKVTPLIYISIFLAIFNKYSRSRVLKMWGTFPFFFLRIFMTFEAKNLSPVAFHALLTCAEVSVSIRFWLE